ncbi:FmdB family zinc ribbon protein [Spelaeicoccus albus]|uniref:Putative FmdB family regulatory protein n=1 Tax=Spelaeicoccus albus TaxID=1280376 RepID=A0A7Z0A975_9MICO|nr:FmdB family zinc ribbon protein [Spelaeicoccus albus]NYI65898.1 putative FmdB family regulatory protein [Spelaeicoccus albus]
MPKYAYACTECGHSFDIHQSFSDETLTICPECEGKLRKVFGAVGVVFKGSGFYRTDSRSSSSNGTSGGSSKSDGNGSSNGTADKSSDSSSDKSSGSSNKSSTSDSSSGGSSNGSSPAAKADSGKKAAASAS